VKCLKENEANITSEACKTELFSSEKRMGNDYRMDSVLNKACTDDVSKYCADIEPGMGRVHQVLHPHPHLTAQQKGVCGATVTFASVLTHPAQGGNSLSVRAGVCVCGGGAWQCLMSNKAALSEGCMAAEEDLQTMMSTDVELRPGFAVCKEEMKVYCADVASGKGRMFRCLQANVEKSDFSDTCKGQMEKKAKRMASFWK
jgi:hypothetical protein